MAEQTQTLSMPSEATAPAVPMQTSAMTAPGEEKKSGWGKWLIIILVIAILGAGIWYWFSL